MSGCRPTEEVHKQATLAGILIGQRAQDAGATKNRFHLVEIAVLGQQLLTGFLSKAAEVVVEEAVIQRPGYRMGRESYQSQDIPAHLPIAKVSRHHEQRPIR